MARTKTAVASGTTKHLFPWRSVTRSADSVIEAYNGKKKQWEPIATLGGDTKQPHNAYSEMIVQAINDQATHEQLITTMLSALELCLENNHLTWEAEQEASVVCRQARRLMGR